MAASNRRRSCRCVRTIAGAFALIALFASTESSAARGLFAIQMFSFPVPLQQDDGVVGHLPVTPYLEVIRPQHADSVCGSIPRVRDAVLRTLRSLPVRLRGDGQLDPQGLDEALIRVINDAMGQPLVVHVHLAHGPTSMNPKTVTGLPPRLHDCPAALHGGPAPSR